MDYLYDTESSVYDSDYNNETEDETQLNLLNKYDIETTKFNQYVEHLWEKLMDHQKYGNLLQNLSETDKDKFYEFMYNSPAYTHLQSNFINYAKNALDTSTSI